MSPLKNLIYYHISLYIVFRCMMKHYETLVVKKGWLAMFFIINLFNCQHVTRKTTNPPTTSRIIPKTRRAIYYVSFWHLKEFSNVIRTNVFCFYFCFSRYAEIITFFYLNMGEGLTGVVILP